MILFAAPLAGLVLLVIVTAVMMPAENRGGKEKRAGESITA